MPINKRFGKAVRFFVERSDFSENEIALYCGLGSSTKLRKIMDGDATMTVSSINEFCLTVNITLVDLFKKVEEM